MTSNLLFNLFFIMTTLFKIVSLTDMPHYTHKYKKLLKEMEKVADIDNFNFYLLGLLFMYL